jgi:phosphate transport system protein
MQRLDENVLRMGSFVVTMLHDAMQALATQDEALAREVRQRDELANQFDDDIEQAAMRLLALQHPVASDLRRIACALKSVTDLERVGDYATDIAHCAIHLAGEPYFAPLEDIPEMGRVVQSMIQDALKTYATRDIVFGKQVRDRDKQVDRLYKRVHAQLLEWMTQEPPVIRQAAELLLAARYLERLGDHTKNVIERVAYAETGSRWPWRSEEWKQAHPQDVSEAPLDGPEDSVDHEE